jgi:membrane associated rhomboid family serine protease
MFRKPGNATIILIGLTTVISLLTVVYERLNINSLVYFSLNTARFPFDPFIWKWITTGFIVPPTGPTTLIFSLLGVYFLGSMLESYIGTKKLLILSFVSTFISFLVTEIIGLIFGISNWFSPLYPFGLGVLFATLSAAWGRLFPYQTVNLMFAIPIKGKWFAYIPLFFLAFNVLYGMPPTEGLISIIVATFIGWNFNWVLKQKTVITQFVTKNKYNIENKEKNKILN